MDSSASSRVKYTYRPGSRFSVPATVVADEIERIRSISGAVTAERVVDESRPEDAPLHTAFEWNDSAAAEQYRRDQARALIRSVRVTYGHQPPVSAFVHVPATQSGDAGDYQPIHIVAQHQDRFDAAVGELRRIVDSAQRSVNELLKMARGGRKQDRPPIERASKALASADRALRQI